MLLPGFDGTGRLFSPLHKQLSNSVETIVLSYPNNKPLAYSELCHLLKDELPNTPYVLLGESFGGPLAMLLSKRADINLKGIILCGSFVKNPRPLLTKILRPFLKPSHFRKATPLWFINTFLPGDSQDKNLLKNIQFAAHELTPEVYYYRLREIADVDVSDILKKCKLPILYLKANNDRIVSEASMKFVYELGREVTVESFDAPHMLLQTQPMQAANSIKSFLDKVAAERQDC